MSFLRPAPEQLCTTGALAKRLVGSKRVNCLNVVDALDLLRDLAPNIGLSTRLMGVKCSLILKALKHGKDTIVLGTLANP